MLCVLKLGNLRLLGLLVIYKMEKYPLIILKPKAVSPSGSKGEPPVSITCIYDMTYCVNMIYSSSNHTCDLT